MTAPTDRERADRQVARLHAEHLHRLTQQVAPWATHPVRAAFDVAFEAPDLPDKEAP